MWGGGKCCQRKHIATGEDVNTNTYKTDEQVYMEVHNVLYLCQFQQNGHRVKNTVLLHLIRS